MINDFDDGCKTTYMGPIRKENDAPNLYQPPLCCFDLDLCHRIAVCSEVRVGSCAGEALDRAYFIDLISVTFVVEGS